MTRKFRIVVCRGPECGEKRDSASIAAAFARACKQAGAPDVAMEWQSCFGRCSQGVNALVREMPPAPAAGATPRFSLATLPGKKGTQALYQRLDLARVERIVKAHIIGGTIVREFIEPPPPVVLPPIPSFLPAAPPAESGDDCPPSAARADGERATITAPDRPLIKDKQT